MRRRAPDSKDRSVAAGAWRPAERLVPRPRYLGNEPCRITKPGSVGPDLAHGGTPLNVLRDPLGQACLAIIGRYLPDVAPVRVIETMKRREWSLG